jgi:hypothetical protein
MWDELDALGEELRAHLDDGRLARRQLMAVTDSVCVDAEACARSVLADIERLHSVERAHHLLPTFRERRRALTRSVQLLLELAAH